MKAGEYIGKDGRAYRWVKMKDDTYVHEMHGGSYNSRTEPPADAVRIADWPAARAALDALIEKEAGEWVVLRARLATAERERERYHDMYHEQFRERAVLEQANRELQDLLQLVREDGEKKVMAGRAVVKAAREWQRGFVIHGMATERYAEEIAGLVLALAAYEEVAK
jgi:hypothetical protein